MQTQKIALTKMNAGSALSFCLRMHQLIHPVVKLKPIKHSIPPAFLHSIYFPFFFLCLCYHFSHLPVLVSSPTFLESVVSDSAIPDYL